MRGLYRTNFGKQIFLQSLADPFFFQEYEKLESELAKYLGYFQLSVQVTENFTKLKAFILKIYTANANDDVKKITEENNSYIKDIRRIIDDKLKQEDLAKIFIKGLELEPIENEPSIFRSVYKGQQVIVSEVSYQIPDNTIAMEPISDSFHSIRRSVVILQRLANLGSVYGCYGLYRQNGRV
ncbi:hypothetical protein RclHR1_00110032 [Rhizophagus clarus]|uniref:Uncharacterized protein n=1 Tax=Rhizophagus clarus TaxID=94130 RepID=A0A2Z6QF95_9GLOM|nr:hypothetical protein RclHR1_00110032 [Rhizophagus clarus]